MQARGCILTHRVYCCQNRASLALRGCAYIKSVTSRLRQSFTNKPTEALPEDGTPDVESAPSAASADGDAPPAAEEVSITRSELVEEFFRNLFPEDFQLALPVKEHMVRHSGIMQGGEDESVRNN